MVRLRGPTHYTCTAHGQKRGAQTQPLSCVPLFLLAIPFAYPSGVWFPNAVFTEGIQSMCYIKICRMSANFVKTNCLPISSLLIIKSCNVYITKEVFCLWMSSVRYMSQRALVTHCWECWGGSTIGFGRMERRCAVLEWSWMKSSARGLAGKRVGVVRSWSLLELHEEHMGDPHSSIFYCCKSS